MFNWWLVFCWVLALIAFLSLVLLSFAFRDASFLLFLQFSFTAISLPLATYFLTKCYQVTKSEKFEEEIDEEEFDLEGRFCINTIQE